MTSLHRLLVTGLLLITACATGTVVGDDIPPDDNGGSESGGGGFGGDDDGMGGIEEGGFGGFAEGGMGGFGRDPVMCSYDSPNVCSTADTIPKVAGDKNQAPQVRTGSTSMWFQIQIEEQDGSIFETDLSYTVTLESPPGMHWDLVVRQGPQDGSPNCNATNKEGVPNGNSEVVSDEWDDDQGIGGEDDSVWLSIGIIYSSGELCDEEASWTLTVQGHT